MSTPSPLDAFRRVESALGSRYRLETMVAASRERVLFAARDTLLNRRVSLRVNFHPDDQTRAWFLREAEVGKRVVLDRARFRSAADGKPTEPTSRAASRRRQP